MIYAMKPHHDFFEMGLTVPEVAVGITGYLKPQIMLLRYAHADVRRLRRKLSAVT